MSYRTLHKVKVRYELTVMGVLIAAFVLAWAMMFVHPAIALLIFFIGLVIAGAGALIDRIAAKAERMAAKASLASLECPNCGTGVHRRGPGSGVWHCDDCGAEFLDTGVEQV